MVYAILYSCSFSYNCRLFHQSRAIDLAIDRFNKILVRVTAEHNANIWHLDTGVELLQEPLVASPTNTFVTATQTGIVTVSFVKSKLLVSILRLGSRKPKEHSFSLPSASSSFEVLLVPSQA